MSKSLKMGIDTLLFLATRKSAGVTEVAEALGVNKSTAFRVLNTFLEANMVEKNAETLKYKLGPAILQLSEQYYKNFNIIAVAEPLMQALAKEIHESVHLCVCANNSAVIIGQVMSDSRLVVNAKIGNSEPLHASSVGKCLLAFAPHEARERMLSQLSFEIFNDKTIATMEKLRTDIEKIKQQGYAVDNGEISEYIRCVAVPVFDKTGVCHYSLGASGAMSRMTQEKLDRIIPLLQKTAAAIFA